MNTIPGVKFNQEGIAEITLWAPSAQKTELVLLKTDRKIALQRAERGYWYLKTEELKENDNYKFLLDSKFLRPDPASRFQPEGVYGPSAAVNLEDFKWTDKKWKNLLVDDYIIYELHTGTFSPEGTFAGIENRIEYLSGLGITAIELMPVAQFSGTRNWGYDGVYPYAVQNSYGGAKALMQLVDSCHNHNIAVILDVVYNHLGPEGNYISDFGNYFTDKYQTPWGKAINFDDAWSDEVRRYFIENALMWFRDFHIDALRLDAVYAIKDSSPVHILKTLRLRVNELNLEKGKQHHLFVESNLNDVRFINPLEKDGFGMDAQWNEEFHHALNVSAGGEKKGALADFNGVEHLAKSYADAFVYDGIYSPGRSKTFGSKVTENPGHQFIAFSQNHNQVGNRINGERTTNSFSFEAQKLLAGALMVSPFIPLIFMGEEWAATNPFQNFMDSSDLNIIQALEDGMKLEFSSVQGKGDLPDLRVEEAYEKSKLTWNSLKIKKKARMFAYYQELIRLRKHLPALSLLNRKQLIANYNQEAETITLQRWHGDKKEQTICCLMNFAKTAKQIKLPASHHWNKILDSASTKWGGPKESDLRPAKDLSTNDVNHPPGTFYIQPQSLIIFINHDV